MSRQRFTGFIGFPDTKMKPVVVPDIFFVDLLPLIDDLNELKLTLHCFWLLNEQDGLAKYLRGKDFRSDEVLLRSLHTASDLQSPVEALEDALERTVARNTLLKLEIEVEGESGDAKQIEDWYFVNTPKGRQTLALVRQGRLAELQAAIPSAARLKVDRPNVFILYEQNIGLLSPIIADQLRDLEKTYPPEWIDEAFTVAVANNKRKLSYIVAVLRGWEVEGKGHRADEITGRDTEAERRRKYIPDEYSDVIRG